MDKYFKFDVDAFYGDYHKNKNLMSDLQNKRQSEIEMSGVDYSQTKIKNTEHGDPTAQKAFRAINTSIRIKNLEKYFEAVEKINQSLEPDEQVMVDIYFLRPEGEAYIRRSREETQKRLCIGKTEFYDRKKQLKRKIRDLAEWKHQNGEI